jgi:lysyl-tRNA synthetase class 2
MTGKSEREIRLEKIQELKEQGINPYPNRYTPEDYSDAIHEKFEKNEEAFSVKIAGRVILKRVFGKALFMTVRDERGGIQIYGQKNELGEDKYNLLKKKVDIGDIIGVEGEVFKTHKGETTVNVKDFELLSKALNPLPEKFHGLTDIELRYRQRYLDMIVNPEVKDSFVFRSKVGQFIRQYLYEKGFIEVETPILQAIPGGAAAKPFITHHNALSMDLYLRIAPELYLKRVITGGIEKVFEMGRVFRNEGMSTRHNPEFTILELYEAYSDFNGMMELTEDLFSKLIKDMKGSYEVEYQGKTYDFTTPWKRIRMDEAVKEHTGIDINEIKDRDELEKKALKLKLNPEEVKGASFWKIFNLIFEAEVEEKLEGPVFVTHYPAETSPLAKQDPENPDFVERFELFIAGREHANAYSELNDPVLQRERLKAQATAKSAGDDEAMFFDEDFVHCLEYAMPPAGGLGVGIDRFLMILLNAPSIRDTLLFPHMRPE